MNQAVKIILTQMEVHPEDFEVPFIYNEHGYRHNAKWEWLTDRIVRRIERPTDGDVVDHLSFLTDEEVHLIYSKLKEIQKGVFTRAVIQTTMSKPKPEEEEDTFAYTSMRTPQVLASAQMPTPQTWVPTPQTWGTQFNNLYGAQGPSPVNPIPTSTKISFDAAADTYEITYSNGFSHTIPKSDVEDAPDYLRSLINSILTKQ